MKVIIILIYICFFVSFVHAQGITITPEELDFGNVSISQTATLEFTLENTEEETRPVITVFPADPENFSINWTGERAEATLVMNIIRSIWNAIPMYHQRYGGDPRSVEQLTEEGFLEIPEYVSANWDFSFIGLNPIVFIEAISTDEMPGGAGHSIIFEQDTGRFEGYGTPLGDPQAPLRAMESLRSIGDAVLMFYQDYQEYPASVERLLSDEYLFIFDYIARKWNFSFIGENPITGVEAVSTAEMFDGMGHVIRYDIESDSLSGYRIPYQEFYDWLWGGEYEHGTLTLSATFQPTAEREFSSEILVRVLGVGDEVDTLRIPVSGNGVMSVSDYPEIPQEFELLSIYPNPFNSTTTIKYTVTLIMPVILDIYDVNGRLVETLVDGMVPAGKHSVVWDAAGVRAGVYLVRMKDEAGRMGGVRRVVHVK